MFPIANMHWSKLFTQSAKHKSVWTKLWIIFHYFTHRIYSVTTFSKIHLIHSPPPALHHTVYFPNAITHIFSNQKRCISAVNWNIWKILEDSINPNDPGVLFLVSLPNRKKGDGFWMIWFGNIDKERQVGWERKVTGEGELKPSQDCIISFD